MDSNSPTAVVITDQEYPARSAFFLLAKIIEEFATTVPQSSYSKPASIAFAAINTYMQQYQDPKQADAAMRVQAELDETKFIMARTGLYTADVSNSAD
jgi:synaptobrevin homolog YKT6